MSENRHERRATIKLKPKKGPKQSGHEVLLAEILSEGYPIELLFPNGNILVSKLISYDKFSVTVEDINGKKCVFFKHAIAGFNAKVASETENV